jgi:hypothetical protein
LRRHRLGTTLMVIRCRSGTAPHPYPPRHFVGEGGPRRGRANYGAGEAASATSTQRASQDKWTSAHVPLPPRRSRGGEGTGGGGQDRRVCGLACAGIVSGRGQWSSLSKRHSPPPVPSPPLRGGRGSPGAGALFQESEPWKCAFVAPTERISVTVHLIRQSPWPKGEL